MKKILLSILVLATCLVSCEKHEEVIDYTLKIGNIYCSDGRIVPPEAYTEDMQGMGVVVCIGKQTDNYKAIAVAAEDLGYFAYSDTLMTFSVSTSMEIANGQENTAALITAHLDKPEIEVPAALAVQGYSAGKATGWHLPSCKELTELSIYSLQVRKSFELMGGKWLDESEWYLSSTQDGASEDTQMLYALCVSMQGRVKNGIKTDRYPVRPFISIK